MSRDLGSHNLNSMGVQKHGMLPTSNYEMIAAPRDTAGRGRAAIVAAVRVIAFACHQIETSCCQAFWRSVALSSFVKPYCRTYKNLQ
jgi:hypothetical protein